MPSYLAASIDVRLSKADLESTTTHTPEHNQSEQLKEYLTTLAQRFQTSGEERELAERPVRTDEPIPSSIRFLGKHQNMPFFLIDVDHNKLARRCLGKAVSLTPDGSSADEAQCTEPDQAGADPNSQEGVVSDFEEIPMDLDTDSDDAVSLIERRTESQASLIPSMNFQDESSTGASHIHPFTEIDPNETRPLVLELSPESVRKVALRVDQPSRDVALSGLLPTKALKECKVAKRRQSGGGQPSKRRCLDVPGNGAPSSSPPRQSTMSTDGRPQALCLTISLNPNCFMKQPYATAPAMILDIKIDIYFNGELCGCQLVPARMKTASYAHELTQRFTGHRIDRLVERPWIVVPASTEDEMSTRNDTSIIGTSRDAALARWKAINQVLMNEVHEAQRDECGNLDQLSLYLESLTQVEMPSDLAGLTESRGRTFGVIDVVVSVGHGRKHDPDKGYLSEPSGMSLSQLKSGMKRLEVLPRDTETQDQSDLDPKMSEASMRPPRMLKVKRSADSEVIKQGFLIGASRVPLPARMASLAPEASTGSVPCIRSGMPPPAAPLARRPKDSNPTSGAGPSKPAPASRRKSGNHAAQAVRSMPVPVSAFSQSSDLCQKGILTPDVENIPASGEKRARNSGAGSRKIFVDTRTGSPIRMASNRTGPKLTRRPSENAARLKPMSRHKADVVAPRAKSGPPSARTTTERAPSPAPSALEPVQMIEPERKPHPRSARMRFYDVITTELTEAEQFEQVQEEAKMGIFTGNHPPSRHRAPQVPQAPGLESHARSAASSDELTPARGTTAAIDPNNSSRRTVIRRNNLPLEAKGQRWSLIVKLRALPKICEPSTSASDGPPAKTFGTSGSQTFSSSTLSALSEVVGDSLAASAMSVERDATEDEQVADVASPAKRRRRVQPKPLANFWKPSPINDSCIITYPIDRYRQVRSERSGWFQESSILMGVRYVIR